MFGWTTGVASLYMPGLRERFGAGVGVLPAPVAASEGPVAVPLDRHPAAGSLVPSAAVYEFVDADEDLGPGTETLVAEELEPHRDYHVLFSHVGGLYRYAVGDVVRVVDRVRGVPRVLYAGRATRSDAAGERLREAQVVRALGQALASTGLALRGVSCRVEEVAGQAPRYVFAVAPQSPWLASETVRFAGLLDTELAAESPGYAGALRERRLGAARLLLLHPDAFQSEWHARVADGVRPTQVKDRLFRQDESQWRRLIAASDALRGEGT